MKSSFGIRIWRAPRSGHFLGVGDPKNPRLLRLPTRFSGVDRDQLRLVGENRGVGKSQDNHTSFCSSRIVNKRSWVRILPGCRAFCRFMSSLLARHPGSSRSLNGIRLSVSLKSVPSQFCNAISFPGFSKKEWTHSSTQYLKFAYNVKKPFKWRLS